MKKIENQQKELLRQKIRHKGIDTIDEQNYILQQISPSIEAIWQKNPEKDLETAYQEVYASLGSLGFAKILDQSQQNRQVLISQLFKQSLSESLESKTLFVLAFCAISLFFVLQNAPDYLFAILFGGLAVGVFSWKNFSLLQIFRSPYAIVRYIFALNTLLLVGIFETKVLFDTLQKFFSWTTTTNALFASGLLISLFFVLYLLNFKILPKALVSTPKQ